MYYYFDPKNLRVEVFFLWTYEITVHLWPDVKNNIFCNSVPMALIYDFSMKNYFQNKRRRSS